MSADVWITEPPCKECGRDNNDDHAFNLTYNLSPMLYAAGMPAWSELMGMPAREAGLIWEAVVEELLAQPARYIALNPENGWGTYDQAVETLRTAAQACHHASPEAVIGGWL